MSGQRAVSAERRQWSARRGYFLGGVVLVAVGFIGTMSPAEAAPSGFWPDYYEPAPQPRIVSPPRVRKPAKYSLPKEEVATDARKPQGPLIIAISIEKQSLKVYDTNGFFAETLVSTGMRGHSTPMGVFSVIQKHKLHHSNIYSGAPMPYMQRITWSGIAMHAGVLPGYPASHGCIRMPMSFAVKMWNWTRMGARVVVTPGEMTPASFSHPLLVTQKQTPQPVAAAEPLGVVAAKSDLELRSTVGHDAAKSAASEAPAPAGLRGQTHTADASGSMSPAKAPVTLSDATQSTSVAPAAPEIAAKADNAPNVELKLEEVAPVADRAEIISTEDKPAEPAADAAKMETADTPNPVEKTPPAATAATDVPDIKKDQTRPSESGKAAPSKPELAVAPAPKRSGQIAVFVSRKDGKLYVRQNFAPLFDVPVTIAPSDRPLGTHVFTAQIDKGNANTIRWSVVSMPARYVEPRVEDERTSRRRKTTGAVELNSTPEPDSAAEALDRLTIPADAMARITDALSTGSSIIVSDQGINTGETGEGTDFIIPLR